MNRVRRLWIALIVLALLTPLGLLLPHWLHGETAWGEWDKQEIHERLGHVPQGMEREAGRWQAPLPDYGAPTQAPPPIWRQSAWYVVSGILGLAAVVGLSLLLGRWLTRHERAADVDD